MGWRPDGTHQFGVVLPAGARGARSDVETMEAVEATSWAQFHDGEGMHLVLSDNLGNIVKEYLPGEWSDISNEVPGDVPPDEEPM